MAGAPMAPTQPKLKPSQIVNDVEQVLLNAQRGKGTDRVFMTAYQILEKLPPAIRTRLLAERQGAGQGTGVYYGAASVVSDAAEILQRRGMVQIEFIETENLKFVVNGQDESGGNSACCAVYRIP